MVTHSRKRGLLNDSEANPKEGAVQHIKRLHSRKMRSGFKRTSSRRSESLDILTKMENNTSGLECSELMMNTRKAKRTKY